MNDAENDFPAPPPERPLTAVERARIRTRVLEGADHPASGGPSVRRRVVPVAAAAAVAVVAAAAGVAGLTAPSTPDPRPAGERAPAASPPSASTASPESLGTPSIPPVPAPAPTDALPVLPEEGGTFTYDPSTGDLPGYVPLPEDCRSELRGGLRTEPVVTLAGEESVGTFHVADGRWAHCTDGPGAVTVTGYRGLGQTYPAGDATPWQVSTDVSSSAPRSRTTLFAAGGPWPEAVTSIEYRFPDGEVRRAETAVDDQGRTWWRMEYAATRGPLVDRDQDQTALEPIQVTIAEAGARSVVPLGWGIDTCAQVNHGC